MSRIQVSVIAVAAAAIVAAGTFYLGRVTSHPTAEAAASVAPAASAGRKVLYWQDPMVPGQRFDKPGKSPYMDMQLQPVYADASDDSGVMVTPQLQQSLGIRIATVKRDDVSSFFDAIGTVQFDERLNVAVQTRVSGYVEHLAVRAPMELVRRGQPMATVFAPDWLGPLSDIVALQRANVSPELVAAARDRARALSIPPELVRQAEETGVAQARYTLLAPASGVVAELGVRDGVAVSPGMTLFRIAGLEKVWAVAEVPEAQAVQLRRGQKVKAALQADPTQTFSGEMTEILPQVNAATHTLQARFEVANKGGKLTPGMLLRLQVAGPTASRLVVPSEAVIRTGTRNVVIVRKANGMFEPRVVKLGVDLGDTLEIIEGLAEGDPVVASGEFLVDSEARLRAVLGNMTAAQLPSAPPSTPAAPTTIYRGRGEVESVDANSITIAHGDIEELNWPAMTMGFGKSDPKAFPDVKPRDRVQFEFKKGGPLDYELVSVHRLGDDK